MRWRFFGVIILLSVQWGFPQSYIIKFTSAQKDPAAFRALLQSAVQRSNSKNKTSVQFSLRQFRQELSPKVSTFPWSRYSLIAFNRTPSAELLNSIEQVGSVEYLQLNNQYRAYSIPNDSAYPSQWNLERIRIKALREKGVINASLPSVIVGVIDTGIDDDHPDLKDAIAMNDGERGNGKESNGLDDDANGFIDDWRGYDFVDGDIQDEGDWSQRDNDPNDENGHGTSVAGIIGAKSGNGIGLSGVSNALLMPLRAFGKNGNGTDIDIASAIVYAADNGAEIINMSFGDVVQSPFLHDAVRYAYGKNVILVASSGNDGTDYPHYPSDFSEVISTGSVGQFNARSFFSSNSPSLDIMAPGEQIVTTTSGGGYTDQFAGTSAAAPHVSGTAAVLLSMQKRSMTTDPLLVPLRNEEIRGILLNSADDAGEPGWDKFYASGIVNAERALTAAGGSIVQIHSPRLDENIVSTVLPIVISAVSPYCERVELYYGIGDSPKDWSLVKSVNGRIFYRDTLTFWNITSFVPNIYQLRLIVKNSKGNDVETRQRIIIDATTPAILSFRYRDSVITFNDHIGLVEARMDRNTTASLYYRKKGETAYRVINSGGLQLNHAFVLSEGEFIPNVKYEFYCLFTENSVQKRATRFPNMGLVGFDHFDFSLDAQRIPSTGFVKKSFTLPAGYLLNSVPVIQGKNHVILNEYGPENTFGRLKAYQFAGGSFLVRDSSVQSWVPRSFVSKSSSDAPLILVQDRGTSQLLKVDTVTGKFFSVPVWGDSTDVWASQLIDLDGDARPEIIARSSSDFLIYRNIGNGQFSKVTQLPNPTKPLSGEAKNQFGPPRSLVGDFSGTGKKEIVFADYDGDLISYRQSSPNSLDFTLAWIDSTDLFEMSDYLAAGDFTGDGIQDIAVAGHSDLSWNQDREYNVPVWTIRVLSHRSADAPGTISTIWEQNVLGVRSGSGYDNGLVSGKLRSTDLKEALFISLNPNLYIVEWDALKKTFVPRWHHTSSSNSLIIDDLDGDSYNDLGFHTDGKTEFWSLENSAAVQTPYALTARPLGTSVIGLTWNSSSTTHRLYRGTHSDSLILIKTVNGKTWNDSSLTEDTRYYYSVSAFNGQESGMSERVSAVPHKNPLITSVKQSSLDQLTIDISYSITSSGLLNSRFILDPLTSTMAASSVVWRSPRSVIATFPSAVTPGNHTLKIAQLQDESGMSADTNQAFPFTAVMTEENVFLATSVSMPSSQRIVITFNGIPDLTTARQASRYTVKTVARTFSIASVDSVSPTSVALNFASGSALNALALRIETTLDRSIRSLSGTLLNSGKGQVLSIAQEAKDLEQIAVYPNPVKNSPVVSFANIPANCRITVYSPNGTKVKTFDERSGREGISWDLKDERGNIVSTGIYLYRVELMGTSNDIISTKLGKFAVIR
jgi:subtilisin family serine protease